MLSAVKRLSSLWLSHLRSPRAKSPKSVSSGIILCLAGPFTPHWSHFKFCSNVGDDWEKSEVTAPEEKNAYSFPDPPPEKNEPIKNCFHYIYGLGLHGNGRTGTALPRGFIGFGYCGLSGMDLCLEYCHFLDIILIAGANCECDEGGISCSSRPGCTINLLFITRSGHVPPPPTPSEQYFTPS